MTPFSMILLAAHLRQFKNDRPECAYFATNYERHTYAAHMGLFKSFGLDHGNAPGEANGSATHIPITEISREQIEKEALSLNKHPGVVIEDRSKSLAQMLTRFKDGSLLDTLTFSIREIIRNVVEHSEADHAYLCAQYWPTRHSVEVGITDCGRGIRDGLSDNERYEYETDREAIQIALLPGVSGNLAAGKGGDDPWQNSGYGLYMTSRICRHAGSFSIYSGEAGMKLVGSTKTDIPSALKGTAVRMVLDTRLVGNLDQQLEQFRRDGQKAAKSMKGAVQITASVASQMLSRNFSS